MINELCKFDIYMNKILKKSPLCVRVLFVDRSSPNENQY